MNLIIQSEKLEKSRQQFNKTSIDMFPKLSINDSEKFSILDQNQMTQR